MFNTSRPKQNGRYFADYTFKYIFLNEKVIISATISLKFVPKGPIYNIPVLFQLMAWRRPGDKPLSEPMMVRLSTHICVTRPQWVNGISICVQQPHQSYSRNNMATTEVYDVIVVGAGVIGSAAALDLTTRGKRVLLLEQVGLCVWRFDGYVCLLQKLKWSLVWHKGVSRGGTSNCIIWGLVCPKQDSRAGTSSYT